MYDIGIVYLFFAFGPGSVLGPGQPSPREAPATNPVQRKLEVCLDLLRLETNERFSEMFLRVAELESRSKWLESFKQQTEAIQQPAAISHPTDVFQLGNSDEDDSKPDDEEDEEEDAATTQADVHEQFIAFHNIL